MNNLKRWFGFLILAAFTFFACEQATSILDEPEPLPADEVEIATLAPEEPGSSPTTAVVEPTTAPNGAGPGWKSFSGEGIQINLPDSFVGGNLSEDLDVILGRLRSLGPDFAPMVQIIEQNPEAFLLFATDSEIGPLGILTSVNIVTEEILSAVSVDDYLDLAEAQFPPQFEVVERDIVSFETFDAGRLLIEFEISGNLGSEVLFVVKEGTNIYVITYATGRDEFEERYSVFEESMESFRVLPE